MTGGGVGVLAADLECMTGPWRRWRGCALVVIGDRDWQCRAGGHRDPKGAGE